MPNSKMLLIVLTAIAIPVLAVIAPGGTAKASSNIYYQWESPIQRNNEPYCLYEAGTTAGLYMDPCSANHSDYWTQINYNPVDNSSEWQNEHSGYCLIVTGSSPGVWLSGCSAGVSVEEWVPVVDATGNGEEYQQNAHSQLYLTWDASGAIDQELWNGSLDQTWYYPQGLTN